MSISGALPVARPVNAHPLPVTAVQPGCWERVTTVAMRILGSPLFLIMTCTAVLLYAAITRGAVFAIACGIASGIGTALAVDRETMAYAHRLLYNEINIVFHAVYHYFKGYHRWSQITDDRLFFIGALPLANFGHLEQLRTLGIRHIIIVTETNERYHPGLFHEPITPSESAAAGVTYWHQEIANSEAIPPSTMGRIVREIDRHVRAGESVYLNSFAGIGRCAAVAEAYLMFRGICATEPEAYAYIRQRHPQAAPNAAQRASIAEALRLCRQSE